MARGFVGRLYLCDSYKVDGDGATPLVQRPLCILRVVQRLCASVWMGHFEEWFSLLSA